MPMISAVQRSINPVILDTADSDISETADQIRSHHSVMVIDTPSGGFQNPKIAFASMSLLNARSLVPLKLSVGIEYNGSPL